MMVGREVDLFGERKPPVPPDAETALEVKGLCTQAKLRNISFRVKKGEILGLYGIVGAGRTETANAIFGLDRLDAGTIFLGGREVRIDSPSRAVQLGIGYITEDRRGQGLIPVSYTHLGPDRHSGGGALPPGAPVRRGPITERTARRKPRRSLLCPARSARRD